MPLTVTIDRSLCIGAAACIGSAPDLFELDEDNIAVLKIVPAADDRKRAVEAAESCPTGAIQVAGA